MGKHDNSDKVTVCFFAHYDKTGSVHEYVVDYLKKLRGAGVDKIYFCSDGDIDNASVLLDTTDCIITGRHGEYDFGSWKRCFLACKDEIDTLLLVNDSCFCVGDINQIMPVDGYEWGGVLQSTMHAHHVQSYFTWFRKPLIAELGRFLLSVEAQSTKNDVIMKYELGMSALFIDKYKPHVIGEAATSYTFDLLRKSPLLKKIVLVEQMWNKWNTRHFINQMKERDMIMNYLRTQNVDC